MELFRTGTRSYDGPLRQGETRFHWLDESARHRVEQARFMLQRLFDAYPTEMKSDLAHRMRADTFDHDAAVAELFFYNVLVQCGFEVQVNPHSSTGSRPDFCVKSGRYAAYVEVTVDTGPGSSTREGKAIDELMAATTERAELKGYALLVNDVTVGKGNPSPRRFARFVQDWADDFDYQMLGRIASEGARSLPRTVYREESSGWSLEITLCPLKSQERRLKSIAGCIGSPARWVDSAERIKRKAREKIRQHNRCGLPLIVSIALNDFVTEPDSDDVVEALLGTNQWIIRSHSESPPVHSREGDGLWSPSSQNASRSLVGLILTRGVFPWTLDTARPELWDNPLVDASQHLQPWRFTRCTWRADSSGELGIVEGECRTLRVSSASEDAQ